MTDKDAGIKDAVALKALTEIAKERFATPDEALAWVLENLPIVAESLR